LSKAKPAAQGVWPGKWREGNRNREYGKRSGGHGIGRVGQVKYQSCEDYERLSVRGCLTRVPFQGFSEIVNKFIEASNNYLNFLFLTTSHHKCLKTGRTIVI
jgi:hypothetical protein